MLNDKYKDLDRMLTTFCLALSVFAAEYKFHETSSFVYLRIPKSMIDNDQNM